MYKCYLDEELLYHPNVTHILPLAQAKVKLEVNKAGTFNFTIYKKNQKYGSIRKMKSIVKVYDDNFRLFRGRVLNAKRGMYNELQVTCEGELAFLVDSKVRPYSFRGAVEEYFTFLVESHNTYVKDERKFKVGRVTVTDPNDYITRENKNYPTTLDEIQDKLIDKLGGYIWTREEEDGVYIDYLEDFELTNTQEIRFGENLVDLEEIIKGQDIATVIIPLGCKLQDDNGNDTGERLTIKDVNDGLDYIFDQEAVDKFGWIEKTVVWDDVTLPENLFAKGTEELQNYVNLTRSIELTAIDLHNVDGGIQAFRYGRYTKVYSKPHDLDEMMLARTLELNILNPMDGLLRLGDERTTFVDKQVQTDKNVGKVVETVEKSYQINQEMADQKIGQATDKINETVTEQRTAILQDCESIILEAGKSYTATGDFESFKKEIAAQVELLASQLDLKFTETTTQIENVNGDLQEKYNTILKNFSFSINGVEIGQSDSQYKMVIDNDELFIVSNGTEVLYASSNGIYTPELIVARVFNFFGIQATEEDDGNRVDFEYVGIYIPLKISSQPLSMSVKVGNEATFSVLARGTDISYQWEYQMPDDTNWVASTDESATTNTFRYTPTSTDEDGMMVRCVVSNAEGSEVISNSAVLSILEDSEEEDSGDSGDSGNTGDSGDSGDSGNTDTSTFAITKQSENRSVLSGESTSFTVVATGNGLTYQWKIGLPMGTSYYWQNAGKFGAIECSGGTTDTITCKPLKANTYALYCIITDSSGATLTSDTVELTAS